MVRKTLFFSIIAVFVVLISTGSAAVVASGSNLPASALQQFGTGFTYQGYLEDQNGPVTGSCDFRFSLFGSSDGADQVGSTQTHTNVGVADGYFTVTDLDFGVGAFQGDARFLEIEVSCPTGEDSYTTLSPRQPISPTPYALALPGMYTTASSEGPNIIGGYIDNTVIDGVFGGTIGGGGVSWGANYVFDHVGTVSGGANNQAGSDDGDYWSADGATVGGGWNNVSTAPISTVGGGADNAAYAYAATVGGGQYNIAEDGSATIAGGISNYATGGSSTIAGGDSNSIFWGWASTIGGGYTHTITSDVAFIGGGSNNVVEGWGGTIGGGSDNYAGEWVASVAGGNNNAATAPASTVGGGSSNTASMNEATVAGGSGNTAEGLQSSVLGGIGNTASGEGATVAGGGGNSAGGDYSFAAGTGAQASHNGSFVWSDNSGGVSSTAENQFIVNATGGVGIGTDSPGGAGLAVSGGGAGNMYLGSKNDENFWKTYLGFNVFHDGTNWVANGDGANNGGALMTTSWTDGNISFYTFPSTGANDKEVTLGNPRMAIYGSTGDVFVQNDLGVNGNYRWQSGSNFEMAGSGEWSFDFPDDDGNDDWHVWAPNIGSILMVENSGQVGIGTDTPVTRLEVANGDVYLNSGQLGIGTSIPNYPIEIYDAAPFLKVSDTDDNQFDNWLIGMNGNNKRFEIWEELSYGGNWQLRFWIDQNGLAGVSKLQITGGDLAEPFLMNGEVEPGMVVVIDPDNPGQLRLSDKANDPLVAGCVSGANGLDAGILMYQEIGQSENAFPVALSGRVYCWADASYGIIQPGDFLTSSDTPGHLMIVKDREATTGAIVGKAMSTLEEGQGLVLMLVTLQ